MPLFCQYIFENCCCSVHRGRPLCIISKISAATRVNMSAVHKFITPCVRNLDCRVGVPVWGEVGTSVGGPDGGEVGSFVGGPVGGEVGSRLTTLERAKRNVREITALSLTESP